MLENQENNENQPELSDEVMEQLTIEQKLEQIVIFPHNLKEVSEIAVKPILDALSLKVTGNAYLGSPTAEEVTIRQELVELNKIIADKDKQIASQRNYIQSANAKKSEVEEYLDENWDNIDEEVREKLCEIFEIEQTVEKEVTISMTGTITVTAPRGYDWSNIDSDIDFDVDVSVSGDLETYGYGFSVDSSDIEVE